MNKNVILTVPIVRSHLFLLYRFISGGNYLLEEDASQNDIYFIVQEALQRVSM